MDTQHNCPSSGKTVPQPSLKLGPSWYVPHPALFSQRSDHTFLKRRVGFDRCSLSVFLQTAASGQAGTCPQHLAVLGTWQVCQKYVLNDVSVPFHDKGDISDELGKDLHLKK